MSSIKQLAIRGTIWIMVGYGSSQFLRLLSNIILTRLLVPELFGLMTLVNTFIMGLTLFSDMGINPSVVRSSRGDDPIFLNTGWTLQVIRGFFLWIMCIIISFPVSQFYEEPTFRWLIPLIGLNSIMSGFSSSSLASLSRHIEMRKLIKIDLSIQVISLTLMITVAFFYKNIWALIIGSLVSSFIKMIWSHRISSIRNRFVLEKDAIQELVSFGRWIFISTAMTFLASQSDRLILGKFLSLEILGIYTIAFTFADIPRQIVDKINNKILFPIISKKVNLPRPKLREMILEKRYLFLIFSAFLLACLFCFGDILVFMLYDERYKDAAWMLPILALGLWPSILHFSINKSLFAIGKPIYNAVGSFLKFLYMLILLPWSLNQFGVIGGLIVIGFNDIPIYFATNYGLLKEGFSCLKQDLITTLFLIIFVIILMSLRYYFGYNLPYLFNFSSP